MDIELNIIKFFGDFKELKNKNYDIYDTDLNYIYVFKNKEDFRSYFIKNGVNADDELLKICTLKITRKGNIIALKQLCDYSIKKSRINKKLKMDEIDKIHERGNLTFSEKVEEWEKNNICAPALKKRCKEFKDCHECMIEYAAGKNEYSKAKLRRKI